MPLITLHNIEKIYKTDGAETKALAGVSFSIEKGEFTALMGQSGSGKSTLLHIIGFLDEQSSGTYSFESKISADYGAKEIARVRNERIGFVFQSFNLLAQTSVLENVKLPLLYSKVKKAEWNERACAAIHAVGLSHRVSHESSKLSGGEKQRTAIARVLVMSPALIQADEPTGNLDSASGKAVMDILITLNKEEGHTIIVITHDPNIARYANRVLTISDGLIVADTQQ